MRDVQTPDQLSESLPRAVRLWAERDYNAAGEWLGQMDPSPIKDAAIQRFSETVVAIDPPAAIIWAGEIEDPQTRARALVSAAERWIATDRPAAERWLADTGLDLDTLRQAREPTPPPAAAAASAGSVELTENPARPSH